MILPEFDGENDDFFEFLKNRKDGIDELENDDWLDSSFEGNFLQGVEDMIDESESDQGCVVLHSSPNMMEKESPSYEVFKLLASSNGDSQITESVKIVLDHDLMRRNQLFYPIAKPVMSVIHTRNLNYLPMQYRLATGPFWVCDIEGNVLGANEEFQQLFGMFLSSKFSQSGELANPRNDPFSIIGEHVIETLNFPLALRLRYLKKVLDASRKWISFQVPIYHRVLKKFVQCDGVAWSFEKFMNFYIVKYSPIQGDPTQQAKTIENLYNGFSRKILVGCLLYGIPVEPSLMRSFPDLFPFYEE